MHFYIETDHTKMDKTSCTHRLRKCLNIFVRLRSKIVIFTIRGKLMVLILDGTSCVGKQVIFFKLISNSLVPSI